MDHRKTFTTDPIKIDKISFYFLCLKMVQIDRRNDSNREMSNESSVDLSEVYGVERDKRREAA